MKNFPNEIHTLSRVAVDLISAPALSCLATVVWMIIDTMSRHVSSPPSRWSCLLGQPTGSCVLLEKSTRCIFSATSFIPITPRGDVHVMSIQESVLFWYHNYGHGWTFWLCRDCVSLGSMAPSLSNRRVYPSVWEDDFIPFKRLSASYSYLPILVC
jgi:hypothetical protein